MAAQTMLLMSGVSTQTLDLKRDSVLKLQIEKMKPNYSSSSSSLSQLFFSPLSSPCSSSSAFKTFAIFKSKAKPAPKKVEKPKLKVEDGIFGTSGGIGFTKENELFVGRVAMLGFAGNSKEQASKVVTQHTHTLFGTNSGGFTDSFNTCCWIHTHLDSHRCTQGSSIVQAILYWVPRHRWEHTLARRGTVWTVRRRYAILHTVGKPGCLALGWNACLEANTLSAHDYRMMRLGF